MQDNKADKLVRILGSCFFILLSAQMIVGCVWGLLNFTSFQEFPESAEMMLLSSGLSLKYDTSIIYPALLLLVRTLTLNGPVEFYEIMYVLQLILAFAAWYTFAVRLLPFKNKALRIWFALAVVTNPFAMQCHLAVLEFSFVSSFLCLLVTFTIRFSLEWNKMGDRFGVGTAIRQISVTSLFWMLTSLTRKEFFFVGLICIVILLDHIWVKLKNGTTASRLLPVVTALVFFAVTALIDSAFRTSSPLSPGDVIKRSPYIRIAWTEDFSDKFTWPGYAVSAVGDDMMGRVMNDPGLVRTDFTEEVEKNFGRKETSDSYLKWAFTAFKDNKKGLLKEAFTDLAGYLFPPLETEIALRGKVLPGFATGNYDVMRRSAPVLTRYYLRLSGTVYIFMALISMIIIVLKRDVLRRLRAFMPAVVVAALSSFIYTFYGSNVWDHKKAVFATCLWIGFFAALSVRSIAGKERA